MIVQELWTAVFSYLPYDPSYKCINKDSYNGFKLLNSLLETNDSIEYLVANEKWNHILYCSFNRLVDCRSAYIRENLHLLHINQRFDEASILYRYFHDNKKYTGYLSNQQRLFYSSYMRDNKYPLYNNILKIDYCDIPGYMTKELIEQLKELIQSPDSWLDFISKNKPLDPDEFTWCTYWGIYAEFRAYYTEPDKRLVSRGSWYREGYDKYPTLTLEESECLKDNEATIHALSNFTIDILYKNNAKICTYRHELYDERVKFINKKMNKSI